MQMNTVHLMSIAGPPLQLVHTNQYKLSGCTGIMPMQVLLCPSHLSIFPLVHKGQLHADFQLKTFPSFQFTKLNTMRVSSLSSPHQWLSALFMVTVGTQVANAYPGKRYHNSTCPPVTGNFTVSHYQLYPENADWDSESCLLYFGWVILRLLILHRIKPSLRLLS